MKKMKLMNRLESDQRWWIVCLGMQVHEDLFKPISKNYSFLVWHYRWGCMGVANDNIINCCLEKPMLI